MARWQPSLLQVSPFRWPLLSMFRSSRSNLLASKIGTQSLYCNGTEHTRDHVLSWPFYACYALVLCMFCGVRSLKSPQVGGGGGGITVGHFGHVPLWVWGKHRASWGNARRVGGGVL